MKTDSTSPLPDKLATDRAGAMPVDAITALCGLDGTLYLKHGESLLIFGASGGIGHRPCNSPRGWVPVCWA